jgi:hypothetical protein
MAYVIYKYEIHPPAYGWGGEYTSRVRMPHDAEILSVGTQGDKIYVWAKVTQDNPPDFCHRRFEFVVMPTGVPIPDGLHTFMSTVHLPNGLVFHIFRTHSQEYGSDA